MRLRWAEDGRRLSRADKLDIERRVALGETFDVIAKATRCSVKSIQRVLARSGGVFRKPRDRSLLRLSMADREELSRGLVAGDSLRRIASRLRRAPSTISREVAANGARQSYRAWRGERSAARRARRPKPSKLRTNSTLRAAVVCGLLNAWSPQQISASLVREHPDNLEMRVSHETIYRSLFVQARGALRKELTAHLRTQRTQRQPLKRTARSGSGRLQNTISISARPAEASDRAVPGHWEGDLIIGQGGGSAIGTLVERRSRYVMLIHLPNGRTADAFRVALARQFSSLPSEMRRSVPRWTPQNRPLVDTPKPATFGIASETGLRFTA